MITQKHGIPALLSCFVVGLGQLVKGEIGRAASVFFAYGLCIILGFVLLFTTHIFLSGLCFIASFIIWVINVMDAYNN